MGSQSPEGGAEGSTRWTKVERALAVRIFRFFWLLFLRTYLNKEMLTCSINFIFFNILFVHG